MVSTHPIAIIDSRADLASLDQRTMVRFPSIVGIVGCYEPVARGDGIPVVDSDVELGYPDLGALDEEDQHHPRS